MLKVIYNICGISGNENVDGYTSSIKSILNQEDVDHKVVVSACMNDQSTLDTLKSTFGDQIAIVHHKERLPVNVTFNNAVRLCHHNDDIGYVYVDSGVVMSNTGVLKKMQDVHFGRNYCMISAPVDTDTGYENWGLKSTKEGWDMPIGKAINLHVQFFSTVLFKKFNRKIMPDIFASHCTESVFTFMCAALSSNWHILGSPILSHATSMDGMSSGFRPEIWVMETGRDTYDHPFVINSILDRICLSTAQEIGFGYEEMRGILPHNPSLYGNNKLEDESMATDLLVWMRENVFLRDEEFNYNRIQVDVQ